MIQATAGTMKLAKSFGRGPREESLPFFSKRASRSKKVAIVGAGVMGLTLAYLLTRKGYPVTVLEKDEEVGGMSASFDFDGLTADRYYHFFCKPDVPVFKLLEELGLSHLLTWRETKMGFFLPGETLPLGKSPGTVVIPTIGSYGETSLRVTGFPVHQEG